MCISFEKAQYSVININPCSKKKSNGSIHIKGRPLGTAWGPFLEAPGNYRAR